MHGGCLSCTSYFSCCPTPYASTYPYPYTYTYIQTETAQGSCVAVETTKQDPRLDHHHHLTLFSLTAAATESTPHSSFCISFPFHSISSATPNNGQHQIKPNQRPGWLADWAGPLVFVSLQHVVWILYMRRVGHRIN